MPVFDVYDGLELRVANDPILAVLNQNELVWGNHPDIRDIIVDDAQYWANGVDIGQGPNISYTTSGSVPTPDGGASVVFREFPDNSKVTITVGPIEYVIDSINGGLVITTPLSITQYPMYGTTMILCFGPTTSQKHIDGMFVEQDDLPFDITGIELEFRATPGVEFYAVNRPLVNARLINQILNLTA